MAQVSVKLRLNFPEMFYLTSTEYGHTFNAETFHTLDDARAYLNELQYHQDFAFSYDREIAIAELTDQIADYLLEESEE